jgi:uncharacterized protein (DUF58 family)
VRIGLLPSRRLLQLTAGLGAASLAVIAFPGLTAVLLAADLAVALLALLDWLLTPWPRAVRAERQAPPRGSLLGRQTIGIKVGNRSGARLSVLIRDDVPPPLRPSALELDGVVPARGEAVFTYVIEPATRGRFTFGAIELRYRSPLGLWQRARTVPAAADIRIYPAVEQVERYQLLARTDHLPAMGVRRVRALGTSWEFESLREFVNGDDTRLMDWKATARRHRLIIRNQQAERNQTLIVLVDCGRLMTAEEQGVSKLDRAVNATLLLAHVSLSRGDRVGLCSFSGKVHSWVAPRPALGQMRLLTDALYDLRADFSESDHARCLRQVALRHNKRALLAVLTDFVDAATAAEMVAAVRHAARRHVVLFVAMRDAFLEEAAHAVAADEQAGFRKAVAVDLLRERRAVLESLRRFGVLVVDVKPADVTANLLNRYLEVSLRGLL